MVRSLLLAIGLCALSHVAAWKDECASFASSYTSDTSRIVATSYYPAGAFVNLTNFAGPVSNSSLPDFCRVQLNITTNPETGSSAATEVWLPDAWNSRLMGLGNGGYFGAVNLRDLAFTAVKQGYAGCKSAAPILPSGVQYHDSLEQYWARLVKCRWIMGSERRGESLTQDRAHVLRLNDRTQ